MQTVTQRPPNERPLVGEFDCWCSSVVLKHLIVVAGDIESRFHQVRLSSENCDSLHCLWWPQGNFLADPVPHHIIVQLFGAKPAPSIAAFCLKEMAKKFGKFFEPHIAQNVKRREAVAYLVA